MTLRATLRIVYALAAGVLFGLGLTVSGMANPAKVLNFLDPFGSWDGSLLFVMVGAILVTLAGYGLLRAFAKRTWMGEPLRWPTSTDIDRRLLTGAGLFGIGWGLAGVCPGPALTLVHSLSVEILLFGVAALAGMVIAKSIYARGS